MLVYNNEEIAFVLRIKIFQDKAKPHQAIKPGVVSLCMVGSVTGGELTLQASTYRQV